MIFLYTAQNPDPLQSWQKKIESMNIQLNCMNDLLLANSSVQKIGGDQTDV